MHLVATWGIPCQFNGSFHQHPPIGLKLCESLVTDIPLIMCEFQIIRSCGIWRTGIQKNKLNTVCLHHLKEYLDKFTTLNPFCCDPFEHHADKKNFRGNL